jgi:predicted transcriptional regulator
MRTTVTLDDDVADELQSLAHERQQPFKRVINETLRNGLMRQRPVVPHFRQQASPMGVKAGIDLTKALAVAASLDDEEILRKLEQGR